jgi:hypothetical protein
MYFEFDATVIQQAVLPQLEFTSYGTITSFTALTIADSLDSFISFVPYQITFTIWRPRGLGVYDVVGDNRLKLGATDLKAGRSPIDNSSGLVPASLEFVAITDKEPLEPVSFQPGDVLGWNQVGDQLNRPLSLVYVHSNATAAVNGFIPAPSQQVPCSVSECDAGATVLSSIFPYFTVKYGEKYVIYMYM